MEERVRLNLLVSLGYSLRDIATQLGRSHSTLSRELRNNRKYGNEYFGNEYSPVKAQELADKRALKQRTRAPLKTPFIFVYVRKHLREPFCWTPEEISNRLIVKHPDKKISTEAIYQYIYSSKGKPYKLWEYLPLARKKRMRKEGRRVQRSSKIPGAVSIEKRPKVVERRKQVGHWETDLIIGKQTDKTALSVSVERVTRLAILSLVKRTAAAKTAHLVERLLEYPQRARKTLTADNGAENSYHQEITDSLDMLMFFCHSYASWEKGTNENTNGRIRRFIPKGISMDIFTDQDIQEIERRLNSTPRKCLQFLTPYEKMQQLLKLNWCIST